MLTVVYTAFQWLTGNFIAMVSLVVSLMIYRRQKTIDNENHLFTYKLDRYSQVISEAATVLDVYYDTLLEIRDRKTGVFSDSSLLDELMDDCEEKRSAFRITLQKCGAFLPKEIAEALDNWFNILADSQDIALHEKATRSQQLEQIKTTDVLDDQLEDVTNLMRQDLGVDTINTRLKKRI